MPKKKYLVTLDDDEREQLEHLLHSGTHATRKVTRARILLKAAEGWEDRAIAEALSVGRAPVERRRQRFVEEGLGALAERPRPGTLPKLDAQAEARLMAEACSVAPAGRQRWTLHLLADRVVALGLAEPYDPSRPKVNFDETTKQLIKATRLPWPAQPGQPTRSASESERNGTRHLFFFVEPQAGWRHVNVTAQRTTLDFAPQMQWLVDERSPEAEVVRVTLDNLHTHKPASLSEAFPPAEARRIARKLECHYTPKHGSWLHMAEIEVSVLQPQCVDRRIPDEETLKGEIAAWEAQRNAEQATIDWRGSVTDAREKLKRLYPSLSS